MGIAIAFVLGVVTSLVASGIVWYARKRKREWDVRHTPHGEILNLDRRRRVVFVFPTRPADEKENRPFRQVSMEDMLAMNYVGRALSLGGWDDETTDYRVEELFAPQRHNPHRKVDDADHNIVSICMSRANTITGCALDELRRRKLLDCEFLERKTPEGNAAWALRWDDVVLQSPTFEQEAELLKKKVQFREGMLQDYALIVKAPNPWSREGGKILIVAGVRGIGTWGAGWFIRERARFIYDRFGHGNFAQVVKVTYDNWRIADVEPYDLYRDLPDKLGD